MNYVFVIRFVVHVCAERFVGRISEEMAGQLPAALQAQLQQLLGAGGGPTAQGLLGYNTGRPGVAGAGSNAGVKVSASRGSSLFLSFWPCVTLPVGCCSHPLSMHFRSPWIDKNGVDDVEINIKEMQIATCSWGHTFPFAVISASLIPGAAVLNLVNIAPGVTILPCDRQVGISQPVSGKFLGHSLRVCVSSSDSVASCTVQPWLSRRSLAELGRLEGIR